MELADEHAHRALAYVKAANRYGGSVKPLQLEEYVAHPHQKGEAYTNANLLRIATQIAMSMPSVLKSEKTRNAETITEYVVRLDWASVDADNNIRLTPLGEAILAHTEAPPIDLLTDEPVSVLVDPADPLAYARIFNLVSTQSDGMLVDPYLKFPQLVDLVGIAGVRRILISDNKLNQNQPVFAQALSALASPPEVRYLPAAQLHDRFFIPDHGQVLIFGSSLNSIAKRPGVVTPITDAAASKSIRQSYNQLWNDATVIEPKSADSERLSGD